MMQYICVVLVLYVAMTSAFFNRDGTLLDDITWPEYRRGCADRDANYTYVEGIGAYRVHTEAATWDEASANCTEEKAHLAIVKSQRVAEVLCDIYKPVMEYVTGTSYKHLAFVGFSDLEQVGHWKTIYGEEMTYRNFKREKNDKFGQGFKRCGGFNVGGWLDDLTCDSPSPYICEKDDYYEYKKCDY